VLLCPSFCIGHVVYVAAGHLYYRFVLKPLPRVYLGTRVVDGVCFNKRQARRQLFRAATASVELATMCHLESQTIVAKENMRPGTASDKSTEPVRFLLSVSCFIRIMRRSKASHCRGTNEKTVERAHLGCLRSNRVWGEGGYDSGIKAGTSRNKRGLEP